MPLTLEERERLAYINGDTEAADLLGVALDGEDGLQLELQMADDRINTLERELDTAYEDLAAAEAELEELRTDNG
jgi:hypothetical protein